MARDEGSPPSSKAGFFSLPRAVRDNIYGRVLVVPHALFFFQESASRRVETFAPDKPARWPALLLTSRQIHHEAKSVLYGRNRFNLVDVSRGETVVVQSFLDCIGSVNAGILSHLSISFPANENTQEQSGKALLREDGLHSLQLLREKCTNVKTLEVYVHRENSRGLVLEGLDDALFGRDTLSQVDAQLKPISSLDNIIVRFYYGRPTPLVSDLMQGLGWVILMGDKDK